MPTVLGTDTFAHGNFTGAGGGPYANVGGSPALSTDYIHWNDPASLRLASTNAEERVTWEILPNPPIGWAGFFWRQNSSEEPGVSLPVARIFTTAWSGATAMNLYYLPASNELRLGVAGSATTTVVVSLGVWHWIEMIFDPTTTTHGGYARVDGVDMGSVSVAGSATSVGYLEVGYDVTNAGTFGYYYSNVKRGKAVSSSDWLGQPTPPPFDYSEFPKPKLQVSVPVRW